MPQDKASYVHRMFTTIAPRYDLLNSLLSFRQDRRWRKFTVEQCRPPSGGLVLDVCTGTGEIVGELARRYQDSQIVGIDFNPDMLARAKTKPGLLAIEKRVHLMLGDALRLPFRDNTFNCATIGFALRNVTDVASAFREMTRVVQPGGRVISLELTRPTLPMVRAFYYIYLRRIAPLIGGIISGKREAYTYLPDSILEFPPPEAVAAIMESVGLVQVMTYRLTLGSATVHVGTKQAK